MKEWIKKHIALLVFISMALAFGILYWEILAFFLVVTLTLVFLGERLGKNVPGVAQVGAVVFLVSLVLVGAVKYSRSHYAKNLHHSQIAWDMEKLDPELIGMPMKNLTLRYISSMSEKTDSAYNKKMKLYEILHSQYLAEFKFDSARFCKDSILVLNDRALADKEPTRKLLAKKDITEYQNLEKRPEQPPTIPFSTMVLPGERKVTEFIMEAGSSYKIKASGEYLFEHSDKYGRAAVTKMPKLGYWQVGSRNGNLTIKNESSNVLEIEIQKERI